MIGLLLVLDEAREVLQDEEAQRILLANPSILHEVANKLHVLMLEVRRLQIQARKENEG